jgi:hypothetical protein
MCVDAEKIKILYYRITDVSVEHPSYSWPRLSRRQLPQLRPSFTLALSTLPLLTLAPSISDGLTLAISTSSFSTSSFQPLPLRTWPSWPWPSRPLPLDLGVLYRGPLNKGHLDCCPLDLSSQSIVKHVTTFLFWTVIKIISLLKYIFMDFTSYLFVFVVHMWDLLNYFCLEPNTNITKICIICKYTMILHFLIDLYSTNKFCIQLCTVWCALKTHTQKQWLNMK